MRKKGREIALNRLRSDDSLDQLELKIANVALSADEIYESEAFQMLRLVEQANLDADMVTRENRDFVQWAESGQESSWLFIRPGSQCISRNF